MAITIRPAVEADQPTIIALIRAAHLNPRNLHWPNFLVAEEDGRIVGVRQVKTHSGGTREVGSGFVLPEYRRRRISARLMREILGRERGALYMLINEKWAPYYAQFGFQRVERSALPADFAREYLIARIATGIFSLFTSADLHIIPLKRDA